MKVFRNALDVLQMCLWAGSLLLLWQDGRSDSLWVGILLLSPPVLALLVIISKMGEAWDHPKFGSDDHTDVITDTVGTRRDWRPHRMAMVVVNLVCGGYMVYAGHGMQTSGAMFLACVITRALTTWTNTTKPGRRIGRALGIPLIPDGEGTP